MIYHVFSTSNYGVIEPFIVFLKKHFNNGSHQIIIYDDINNIPNNDNFNDCIVINRKDSFRFRKLKKHLKKSDKIILHSAINNKIKMLFVFNNELISKTYWVMWGADLYESNINKTRFIRFINSMFFKKIEKIVGIFNPDIEYFKRNFNYENKIFFNTQYIISKPDFEIENQNNKRIRVLIGHQSTKSLRHIDVLKLLNEVNREIDIVIPLNYGDQYYGDEVKKYAENFSKHNVNILEEKLSKQKYLSLLSSIDIAVFNTKRQIGLGNIYSLFWFNKKVFLPKNSTMYNYFNSLDLEIFSLDNIKIEIEQFKVLKNTKNHEYMKSHIFNQNKQYLMWMEIFND